MSTNDYQLQAFDPGEARERLRNATGLILSAEKVYEEAVQHAAECEALYRVELAKSFQGFREGGDAVEAARIAAHGATATYKKEAIASAGMVKVQADRLENVRDTRRSLWRLVEWSAAREARAAAVQGRLPENSPAGTWP